ncbi:MAG: hypothetical protein ACJ76V_16780 [Thermoleophilaceae bacterium]
MRRFVSGKTPDGLPAVRQAQVRARVVRRLDEWREAAYEVEAASRRWRDSPTDDQAGASSGFFAALEREEKAATEYESAWRAWRSEPSLVAVER